MQNKILVTGGNGRLATELKKHLEADYVDIQDYNLAESIPKGDYDLVVHLAAYTNVSKAQTEPINCFRDNVIATWNLSSTYTDTPIIYISTEYANKPLGVYALTKRLGETVMESHPTHLIIRTSFKPNPFPFEYAYEDQYTQGDYVDVIAKLLAERVKSWDRKTSGMEYLGTGRKTMIELAKRTRPDVKPNKVDDYNTKLGVKLIPHDYQD